MSILAINKTSRAYHNINRIVEKPWRRPTWFLGYDDWGYCPRCKRYTKHWWDTSRPAPHIKMKNELCESCGAHAYAIPTRVHKRKNWYRGNAVTRGQTR